MKALLLLFIPLSLLAADLEAVKNSIDEEGDKILILDADAREKIHANDQIKATNVYDDESNIESFKKNFQEKVLTDDKQYGEYVVVAGDNFGFISQKVYGTAKRWKDIQIANEKLLEKSVLRPGLVLKYPIYKKENDHDRKTFKPEKKRRNAKRTKFSGVRRHGKLQKANRQ